MPWRIEDDERRARRVSVAESPGRRGGRWMPVTAVGDRLQEEAEMRTLILGVPHQEGTHRVSLQEGDHLLVGRAPNPATLPPAERERLGEAPQRADLLSPNVSANHASASHRGGLLRIRDLGSRNGTWVRVPHHEEVTVSGDGDVLVHLSSPTSAAPGTTPVEALRYTSPDTYGEAIASSVREWLRQRQITARARLVHARVADDDAAGRATVATFPLASGASLRIEIEQTVDSSVLQSIEGLSGWIAEHDQMFRMEEETRADGMILASPAIRQAHGRVVTAARRGVTSLVLLGPTGSGKERLARAFHRYSGRSGPFVAINCAMLDRELARADLFGAEVGAYTGSVRTRIGALERAHGGTLFLDEIGDMSATVQPLMLRFLDANGEFERMGGDGRIRHADVRIVCATHQNLREASSLGTFRKDLWWRLAVEVVDVPPLRARFEDISAYLAGCPSGTTSALNALAPEALELLRRHPWDGNFRELKYFAQHLPQVTRVHEITATTLRAVLASGALTAPVDPMPAATPPGTPSPQGLAWGDMVGVAAAAFADDHGHEHPTHWGDVATFIEQYLKPIALRRMVSAIERDGSASTAREVSQRVQADAKTISKHLHRYGERFDR
jgi:transcriptional regulator with GAF, ATPase, and Fis domain